MIGKVKDCTPSTIITLAHNVGQPIGNFGMLCCGPLTFDIGSTEKHVNGRDHCGRSKSKICVLFALLRQSLQLRTTNCTTKSVTVVRLVTSW